ncbi:MAG: hypothetical protein JEZ03_12235 [Bacteroidales bacterium]|nr:hypothetical protein [Bacteroidales bacterium]
MEVRTDTQVKKTICGNQDENLLDLFLLNSKNLGHDSLKVDSNLFAEAAKQANVQFEFIRLKSFDLNKTAFDISSSKNAILEADFGIADSGKLVINTEDSDVLVTLLLAESLHIILPSSKILSSISQHNQMSDKPAVDMFRGISSNTAGSYNNELCFSPTNHQTVVYVIEDL